LAGCAKSTPQNYMAPEGPDARTIDRLQTPVFIIAGVVGLLVAAAIIFIVIKFRARPGHEDEVPRQLHGAPRLEIAWTIVPAILLAGIAVPTIKTVFDLAEKPKDPLHVTVIGQQWWWEFDYPGYGIVTANELVVPVGTPVQLAVTSRDVIHSFWIPKLNGKKDAVPNRSHFLRMTAEKPGEYWGQCTEFCGLSHANMRQRVVALAPADFDQWVKNQQAEAKTPTDPAALRGQALFESQCVRCHTVNGLKDPAGKPLVSKPDEQLVSGAAPNLTHVMSRTTFAGGAFPLKLPDCANAAEYDGAFKTGTADNCLNRAEIERWLRNPPAMKPMYAKPSEHSNGLIRGMPNLNLSEAQIDDLVAYLVTLK